MAEKLKRLWRLQWQVNVATGIFSAIAIGLAYARLGLLAQLSMIPIVVCFGAACWIAYKRYQLNRQRRDEIFAQLEDEEKSTGCARFLTRPVRNAIYRRTPPARTALPQQSSKSRLKPGSNPRLICHLASDGAEILPMQNDKPLSPARTKTWPG